MCVIDGVIAKLYTFETTDDVGGIKPAFVSVEIKLEWRGVGDNFGVKKQGAI